MCNKQNEVETSTTTPTTPFEFLDSITVKNHALRAFGALLRTADLSEFDGNSWLKGSPGKVEAESLQWGLSQIIDLYLADQEQAVEDFADECHGSDAWILESASSTIKLFEEGMWNQGHIPMDVFSKDLERLETVIDRNPVLKPVAEALKSSFMKHIPRQVQSINQGGAS